MKHQLGISLAELLFAIGIISILLTLGVGNFTALLHHNRVSASANAFVRAVHLANNESVKQSRIVTLCPSLDLKDCAADRSAWSAGWLVFVNHDRDRPPRVDANEPVVLAHAGDQDVEVSANRLVFEFRQFNRRSTNGTLVFCSRRIVTAVRAVVISYTGRPRVARRRADGKAYGCEH